MKSIFSVKDNFRIQKHRMYTSAIKKQTSVCCSISLNPYMVFGIMEKRKEKGKQFYCYSLYC